jgi:hypothetical protein
MAVPNSGQLSLKNLARERFYYDYNYPRNAIYLWDYETESRRIYSDLVSPKPPISLRDLHEGSPISNTVTYYDTINTLSAFRPDQIFPYSMSEFYRYNEDYGPSVQDGTYSVFLRHGFFLFTSEDTKILGLAPLSYLPTTDTYFYNPDDLVFERFQSNDNVRPSEWRKSYLLVDEFRNKFIRPNVVFYNNTANQFKNDVCVSGNWVFLDENLDAILDEDEQLSGWDSRPLYNATSIGQRGTAFSGDTSVPSGVTSWTNIPFTEDASFAINRWAIRSGSTTSAGTGPSYEVIFLRNGYVYIDSFHVVRDFWLSIGGALDSNNNLSKYFYFESSGSTVGHKWFRWSDFRIVPSNAKYLTFCYSAWSENGHLDFSNDYLQIFFESQGITPPPTFG